MKAPAHEVLSFGRDGGYKTAAKNFWLGSNTNDAYGKKIFEGDRVRVREEMATYTAEFNGNTFILVDALGCEVGRLEDFDSYELEVIGHIAEGNHGQDN